MSECSPYIRQAVERCKLPISVECLKDGWFIIEGTSGWREVPGHQATATYLDIVKELTK